MRKKSEARREAILQTALEVFREMGFEAASMSQIAARVGGSKATLYNYFSSKEELLMEAMTVSARQQGQDIIALIGAPGDIERQLQRFVSSVLQLVATQNTLKLLRVAVSVSNHTNIGRHFYDLGTEVVWRHVANYLEQQVQRGVLKPEAPEILAMHLRCLCESDLFCLLLGACSPLRIKEADEKAALLVSLFLRAHGASNAPGSI